VNSITLVLPYSQNPTFSSSNNCHGESTSQIEVQREHLSIVIWKMSKALDVDRCPARDLARH